MTEGSAGLSDDPVRADELRQPAGTAVTLAASARRSDPAGRQTRSRSTTATAATPRPGPASAPDYAAAAS